MNLRKWVFPILGISLVLSACDSPETVVPVDVVARAQGVDLRAETVAELLAPRTELPNRSAVVSALAELWVDYFLLARTLAQDTTLANLDVSPLVQQNTEQEIVFRLRDSVIQADTTFTDEELRDIYERDLPGTRIRARHILFRFPEGATEAQQDSVWAQARSIRERILDGESFAMLAGEFSQDQGTAINGGDLGTFSRGQMVPQFEEVAFNLDVGEVSEVVETMFGLHIILLEEKTIPPFEENLDQFRIQLKNRRIAEAESTYLAGILEKADLEILSDGFETARQLAQDPTTPLTARALDRPLFRYNGGEFTAGDFRSWIMVRPPPMRQEIRRAEDQRLEGIMRNIAQERLLIREARQAGMEVPQARVDTLSSNIRDGVKTVARQLGFFELVDEAQRTETEDLAQAVNEAVVRFLGEVVAGRQRVVPLGGISNALRLQYDARVNPAGVQRAQDLINSLRTQPQPSPPTQESPDTTGSGGAGPEGQGDRQDGTGNRNP